MVTIGEKAPNLKLGKWVQGMETNFDKEGDNVKLVEVFQVNCPGCFMHSIPEIINIYQKFKGEGVIVMGVASAFEDYHKGPSLRDVIGKSMSSIMNQADMGSHLQDYENEQRRKLELWEEMEEDMMKKFQSKGDPKKPQFIPSGVK